MKGLRVLFIIGLIIIGNYSIARAQAANQLPLLSVKNISVIQAYVQKNYKVKGDFEMNACFKGVIYIKFKVAANGKIDSLDISKSGPPEIKQALKAAIKATSGSWEKQRANTYMLPVICLYEMGCTPGVIDSTMLKMKPINAAFTMAIRDGAFQNTVREQLNFENATYQSLNCILIAPMVIGLMD